MSPIPAVEIEDFPAQAALSPPPAWPEPISATELCASPPATPSVLIEGILYRGGTMLISGPSKSHKTYSMLDLGCAVADGRSWLGFKAVKTPVLALNLELQDFATAKRIHQICSATGTNPPSGLHIWNLRGHRVTLLDLTAKLPQRIKDLSAGMVLIDPHYKVSAPSGMEENSNDSQGALLSALEGLCGLNGAALVCAHHFAKGDAAAKNAIDRASGGGVFARWGDVMLTFTPHEEADAMTVEMALRNFAPVAPFAVRWEHPRWIRDDALDPAKLKRAGAKEKHTPDEALQALGSQTLGYCEWQKATKMADSTFRRKRDALIDAGKVEQVGNLYRAKTP
ncbi:MAG: AAA family ATPase [Opitutaceae bacterium]